MKNSQWGEKIPANDILKHQNLHNFDRRMACDDLIENLRKWY